MKFKLTIFFTLGAVCLVWAGMAVEMSDPFMMPGAGDADSVDITNLNAVKPVTHGLVHGMAMTCTPNPFTGNLRIALSSAGIKTGISGNLNVYDVSGACVFTHAFTDVGELSWDGTGLSGVPVPAGIYLIELKSGATALQRRVLLVK